MTIWRDWSAIDSVTGKPRPGATHSWWHYCHDCHKLTGPIAGPVGPRGWVADSDEGVPSVIAEALRHQCKPRQATASTPTRPPRAPAIKWTPEMDDVVRDRKLEDAADALGVSMSAVSRRRARLGVVTVGQQWTDAMDDVIITSSVADAVARLGLGRGAVEWRRRQLRGMGRLAYERKTIRPWTPEEDALIQCVSLAEGARATGRSTASISNRRIRLRKGLAA